MKNNKQMIIILLMSSLFFAKLSANDKALEELINIAIHNNNDIKINKEQENINNLGYESVKSKYFPKISMLVKGANAKIKTDDTVSGTLYDTSITINQLIYDFGKTTNEINSLKEDYAIAKLGTAQSTSLIVLKIKQIYYEILSDMQRIKVAKESIRLDELHLEKAEKYFKAGVRALIDVTDAKLRLSNSKSELLKVQFNLKKSQSKLISILGIDNSSNIKIDNEMNIMPLAKQLKKDEYKDLDSLIELAYENRPEIKIYDKLITSKALKIKSINAEYYPRLDFGLSYSDRKADEIESDTNQLISDISLKWDLYTGDSTKKSILIEKSKLKILMKQKIQQKLKIKEDITSTYFNLKENEQNIDIGLLSLDLASSKLDLASKRYQNGLNDLVELNEARLQYIESKNKLINLYFSYLSTMAQLDYEIGVIK